MHNSIRGSLCISGTTKVRLSSNTTSLSKIITTLKSIISGYRSDYF